MDKELLRKVQLAQLEIAKEIKRVCDENGIGYFLACGTLLGAVRHQGFIPWDDDLDMGMPRQDYDRFCALAPEKLGERFVLQSWYTDPEYPLPFAKVRLRNTVYLEAKSSFRFKECGVYVDVFPFDYAPVDEKELNAYTGTLANLYRIKLMKSGSKPWMEGNRIVWKKRIGYAYYQLRSLTMSQQQIAEKYDSIASKPAQSDMLFRQRGLFRADLYRREWYEELTELPFEGELFKCPAAYHAVLTAQFGDYMVLPPEDQRENRHQITKVDLGNNMDQWEEKQ